MSYTVPQLLISQEFVQIPTFTQSPLSPLIIGPDIRNGVITAIALGTAGAGYYSPVVSITDAVSGADAVATATMAANNSKGAIHSVSTGSAGSLYTIQPIVSVADATGSGAQITATWDSSGHTVTGYVVVAGGSGYSSPTITVNPAGGDSTGSGATGTAVLGTGVITGYVIVNGGAGYNAPTITITDSNIPTGGSTGSAAAPGTVSIAGSHFMGASSANSNLIGLVNSTDDIDAAFGSHADPTNPLAYALYNAVQNANSTTVYYAAVVSNDVSGYNTALALAEKSNIYYGIVPLSTNTTIMDNVVTHVNKMSEPALAKWRTCWLSPAYSDVTSYTANEVTIAGVESADTNVGPRRVHFVFPDTYYPIDTPNVSVAGYFMAAGLAGLRGGSVPHQSLTNTQLIGPFYLDKCVSGLTVTQLNTLAGAGTWIVTQDTKGGIAYNRHQLTGDNNNTFREDTITANVDSVSYGLQSRLAPFIGIYNITPANLLKVRAAIDAELSFRLTNTFTARAGNQLLGYKIVSIAQDAIQNDKINVVITLQVPYPMNFVTVSLSI